MNATNFNFISSDLKSLPFRDPIIYSVPSTITVKKYQKYDRFLVNLYSHPPPSSERRKSINRSTLSNLFEHPEKSKLRVDKNSKNNSPRKMTEFLLLRSRRDVECLKMKEASNIISHLSKCPNRFWTERLLAEKVLLESGKRIEILKRKIGEDYVSSGSKEVKIGSLTLSHFKFNIKASQIKRTETLYFVLVLSNDDEVKVSKIQRGTGEIAFNERFVFPITLNFRIKVQLYCYTMKNSSRLSKVFPWKTSQKQSTTKLQYKNLNTSKYEESSILKTSFKLCTETEVVPSNVHDKVWTLQENSTLENFSFFSVGTDNFKIECKRRGFASVGLQIKDFVVWNRRWCSLNGSLLMVFSSPEDEYLVPPLVILDLAQCSRNEIEEAPREVCNRKRSILIEVRNEKYFFMFDTAEDLKSWLSDINTVLKALRFKNCYNL